MQFLILILLFLLSELQVKGERQVACYGAGVGEG